jgi:hypothetical protein
MDVGVIAREQNTAADLVDEFPEVAQLTDLHDVATPGNQVNLNSPNFVVPTAFWQPLTMVAAWASWYGTQKDVSAVAEKLMKVRSPALTPIRDALKRVKHPAGVLLYLLGVAEYRSAVEDVVADFEKLDASSRLDSNLIQLLGTPEREQIKALCTTSPATEVIEAVVGAWPISRSLFEVGVFNREMAYALLCLSAIEKMSGDGQAKLSQHQRHRRDMAATVLLQNLPTSVVSLLLDSSDYLASLLKILQKMRAEIEFLPEKVDPLRPLHLQLTEDQFADLVEDITVESYRLTTKLSSGFPRLLDRVESQAVALRPGRNAIGVVYTQYVDGVARPEWQRLLDALSTHAKAMEVSLDQKLFASDLVGKDIAVPRLASLEAVALIRALINSNSTMLTPGAFIERADNQLSKVRDLHVQIAGLGQNLTAAAMGKLAALAAEAQAEILSNQGWFKAEVDGFIPLVKVWQRFYDDWDRLSRKGTSASSPKPSAPLALVERFPAPAASLAKPASPDVVALQEELDSTLSHCENLERELREVRTELHGHRAYRDAMSSAETAASVPQVDRELMRRVALREGLTPADVLAFIQFTAEDRVVVLDSAWKSAKEASSFQYTPRMLEVLNTMVFPYFEALKGGNPDAVARELLAGTYSAKESHTVANSPRFRSQREFQFEGETRYFERHLKIGNGTGLDGMRIYFDIIGEKIVIAYAGPHLECSTTS